MKLSIWALAFSAALALPAAALADDAPSKPVAPAAPVMAVSYTHLRAHET